MKNIRRILFLITMLAIALLISGCAKKEAKMDKATFEGAVNFTDDNVTVRHTYDYDGMVGEEETRVTDGKAYVNITGTDEWLPIKASICFHTIVEISRCYDSFTVKDGKYFADTLTVMDEEGLATYLSKVTLEFNSENRLVRIYYEYENGASLDKYTYEFSNYGTTVAPK